MESADDRRPSSARRRYSRRVRLRLILGNDSSLARKREQICRLTAVTGLHADCIKRLVYDTVTNRSPALTLRAA
jgi:hypothetical protein